MDLSTVATAVVALLSPYLAKAGEAFAEEAGEKLAEKLGALYQAVKSKFKGDIYAEQSLARVKEEPKSEGRQAILSEVLLEKMKEDPAFAEALRHLVEESRDLSSGDAITQTLVISGKSSGDVFQIGKLDGNITQS